MSDELPEGWASARLRDGVVAGAQTGFACGKHSRDAWGVAHLRPMNVNEAGRLRLDDVKFIDNAEVDRDERWIRSGDVLFNNTNSPELVGKTALYTEDAPRAFSNHMTRVRCTAAADPQFLAHAIHQKWREGLFASICNNHVSQASISTDVLLDLELPIPPLAEQRRIVAKVEALLEQVRRAKDRLDRVPMILKRFRQAVLAAACSGTLTETWRARRCLPSVRESISGRLAGSSQARTRRGVPEQVELPDDLAGCDLPASWTWASVAELLRASFLLDVKDGNHGANHPKVAEFSDEGLPFITAAQVNGFAIDYAGAYKLAGRPLERIHVGHAKAGDAILTHKGSVGRTAVCERDCVLTPQTTYYRPDPAVIDARFLMYLFASPGFYAQLAAVMSQTTRDFVPISEQYLLFLSLPPVDEQREIVRRVDALFFHATAIEQRVGRATAASRILPQAILSKAFAGELVPTEAEIARAEGRDYETAQQLVQRMNAVDPSDSATQPRKRLERLRAHNTALRAAGALRGRSR